MNVTEQHRWSVNIGSRNGLVSSGNKPLPDPDRCRHMVSLGHNELKNLRYFYRGNRKNEKYYKDVLQPSAYGNMAY